MREIDHALKVSFALLDNEPNRIVLCPRCAAAFYESSAYYIKRVDQYQTVRAKCDYCNMHFGYDYWLTDTALHCLPVSLYIIIAIRDNQKTKTKPALENPSGVS